MNKVIIYVTLVLIFICAFNNSIFEKLTIFPVRDKYCENKDLKKAYGPKMCILEDGSFNLHTSCRCEDPITGFCKECYPEVKKPFATLVSKKTWNKMMNDDYY